MISIIIPLYNKEVYIAETLSSVLAQTYTDFEIIIVDDGSTDDSLKIAKTFESEKVTVTTIPNSGVSVARNKGISLAKYNWIAFLDADDWWDKSFLKEIVNAINVYPSEKVFASGRSRVFLNTVESYQNKFLPEPEKTGIVDYIKIISQFLPPINSSNVVIDKQTIITAGLFKEGQKRHEDHDLWLRICSKNNVVLVNKNLSFYRKEIANSGSQGVYAAQDFMRYLQTIQSIKEKLHNDRLDYFKKYYNRFILLTFIKFEGKYSKEDKRNVYQKAIEISDGKHVAILKAVKLLPSGFTYSILKKIKK